MKRLNDYFIENKEKRTINHRMSLCGKLEAIIGNYFLSGAGIPDNDIQSFYERFGFKKRPNERQGSGMMLEVRR